VIHSKALERHRTNIVVGWTAVFGSEAVFFCILIDFWAEGAVPQGALCEYSSLALTEPLLSLYQ
jgi:hypothetical protein